MRSMSMLRTVLAAAGFAFALTAAAFAAADEPANLDYSPWTRTCRPDPGDGGHLACFTISSGRIPTAKDGDAPAVSAMVMQQESNTSKVLRIIVPLGVQVAFGTRLLIDGAINGQRAYVACFSGGCFSDYPLDDAMLGLTSAKNLAIQAINSNGAPLTLSIPLAGFAQSYAGGAADPTSLDRRDGKEIDAMLALKPDAERAEIEPTLSYVPWAKLCPPGTLPNSKPVCFTGTQARTDGNARRIAAVVAIVPEGNAKRLLRITLPTNVQLSSGVTYAIDDQPGSQAAYVICFANGCMADTELTATLIDSFKSAKRLTLRFNNFAGRTVVRTIPMEDFGQAFDGPATVDLKAYQASQKK